MLGESLRERFGHTPEVLISQDAVKLLSSSTRMSILRLLDQRRMTVSELARALGLNKSTVHEHLGKMVDGGLLRRHASTEREWVYYELTRTGKYVLQPHSARFVLLPALAVAAALTALVALHFLLAAGAGLVVSVDEPLAPAGASKAWTADLHRAGFLGNPQPVEDAELYLLSAEQVAQHRLLGALPSDARPLGAADGLTSPEPGRYTFRAGLAVGMHYLMARDPATGEEALFPLHVAPVTVAPVQASLLQGIDAPVVEVEVRFQEAPVEDGRVAALDERGHTLAQAEVVAGRARLALAGEAPEHVRFAYQAEGEGSTLAQAEGGLLAPRPHVAFTPTLVPTLAPTAVRVVVDDPLTGPRADAQVSVLTPDGGLVARGRTGPDGAAVLPLHLREAGAFVVQAGGVEVGTLTALPGVRLGVEAGPHREGEDVRVRSLLLGAEPDAVPGATVYVDGRELGTTDADGWLTLEFGLGGKYTLEVRREGHVPASAPLEVLPRTGYSPMSPRAAGSSPEAASPEDDDEASAVEVEAPKLRTGEATQVHARLVNRDSLPRVLRADLWEDGRVVATRTAEAAPGASVGFTFPYAPEEPGVYRVAVNDLPPVAVEVAPPAERAPPGLAAATTLPVPGIPAGAGVFAAFAVAAAAVALIGRSGASRRRR